MLCRATETRQWTKPRPCLHGASLVPKPFLFFVQVRMVDIPYPGSARGRVFIHFRAEEKTQHLLLTLQLYPTACLVSRRCLIIISCSNSSKRALGLCPPSSYSVAPLSTHLLESKTMSYSWFHPFLVTCNLWASRGLGTSKLYLKSVCLSPSPQPPLAFTWTLCFYPHSVLPL